MKYQIKKEFFPFSHFAPPIRNARMAGWMGSKMKPPRWVRKNRDSEVFIRKENIQSYDRRRCYLAQNGRHDARLWHCAKGPDHEKRGQSENCVYENVFCGG